MTALACGCGWRATQRVSEKAIAKKVVPEIEITIKHRSLFFAQVNMAISDCAALAMPRAYYSDWSSGQKINRIIIMILLLYCVDVLCTAFDVKWS